MHTLTKLTLGSLIGLAAFNAQAETRAVIDTNMGQIRLSLDEQKAPKTVANFVSYADKGFYNNTIFHRVIDGFMIQGGGFTADMKQKPTDKAIANEADNGLQNHTGTIAMARTAAPNSATSQFFINVANNDSLNFRSKTPQGYGYTVFGKVTGGMDVVNRIAKVQTTNQAYHQNVPLRPVVIQKISIIK
ncbi:peptidyl-prolyl cis-trans isomerase [Uruburuella testudinis]|uniref:Peptidyl-prolyl cis-trans isomerase n=1 Tax=Uruburuella testudinis TaxID=1282863 RepID=A0ABY4DQB6_9NEIS|nr:peptidylprolyl isomerase [Uruburuella testudinis]UOO81143.1 peptidyl-prolyl cis-trans isomerase [Uruburuella testudinis]